MHVQLVSTIIIIIITHSVEATGALRLCPSDGIWHFSSWHMFIRSDVKVMIPQ
jgi:hypothetical protein